MILCQCTGVTDATVCGLIREGVVSVDEIGRRCGAGRCCLACREAIAAMIGTASASSIDGGKNRSQEGTIHEG